MTGYRDDALFGEGFTDPGEVSYYETEELGNSDIPEMLLSRASLNKEQRDYLQKIIDGEVDSIDKQCFIGIVRDYVGDRDFCKWLCSNPKHVYENYIKPFSANDVLFSSYDDYKDNITVYQVPSDAVMLADLGDEGTLYAWRK